MSSVSWDIEERVRAAMQGEASPSACPSGCLYVPRNLQSEVLQWAHNSKQLTCHPGILQTRGALLQHFWWPSLEREKKESMKGCPTCTHNKVPRQGGLLQPLPVPRRPRFHVFGRHHRSSLIKEQDRHSLGVEQVQ